MLSQHLKEGWGNVQALGGVESADLAKISQRLIGGFIINTRSIGVNQPDNWVSGLWQTIDEAADQPGLKERAAIAVRRVMPTATLIGLEAVRSDGHDIVYTRPWPQDPPKGPSGRERLDSDGPSQILQVLKDTIQLQLPLQGPVYVDANDYNWTVEPGQIFVPRFGIHHRVLVPPNSTNLELVYHRDVTAEDAVQGIWKNYIRHQAHTIG